MKKMLEKIDYSNPENKYKMNELFEMLLYETKEANYNLYEDVKCELYEMVYGKKISEEMAEEWVHDMKPMAKWTMEETTNAMQQMGYNLDKIDFYVVANMMYSDYHDLVEDDGELALKMAYDWLNDEDTKKDKLYEYWKHIVKRD